MVVIYILALIIGNWAHFSIKRRCASPRKKLTQEEVREEVIALQDMGNNIRSKHVHDFDSGHAFIFAVDNGTAEHIAGDCIKYVFFLMANFVYVTGKH